MRQLLYEDSPRGLQPDLVDRVLNVLATLLVVPDMDTFRQHAPPGWRIHQLTGDRKGQWSVSVTRQWRITFTEENNVIQHLHLENYH